MFIQPHELNNVCSVHLQALDESDVSLSGRLRSARLLHFFLYKTRRVETYGFGEFCGSSAKVDGLFLLHDVKAFLCSPHGRFLGFIRRCVVIFTPQPRLYFGSPPAVVGVDANYLTVKCCVQVLLVNSFTLTNSFIYYVKAVQ